MNSIVALALEEQKLCDDDGCDVISDRPVYEYHSFF